MGGLPPGSQGHELPRLVGGEVFKDDDFSGVEYRHLVAPGFPASTLGKVSAVDHRSLFFLPPPPTPVVAHLSTVREGGAFRHSETVPLSAGGGLSSDPPPQPLPPPEGALTPGSRFIVLRVSGIAGTQQDESLAGD